MGQFLRVDADALRELANSVRADAGTIAAIRPADPLHDAAAAMPQSATSTAIILAAEPITDAYTSIANQIQAMAAKADSSALTYEDADHGFEEQLQRYQQGH